MFNEEDVSERVRSTLWYFSEEFLRGRQICVPNSSIMLPSSGEARKVNNKEKKYNNLIFTAQGHYILSKWESYVVKVKIVLSESKLRLNFFHLSCIMCLHYA